MIAVVSSQFSPSFAFAAAGCLLSAVFLHRLLLAACCLVPAVFLGQQFHRLFDGNARDSFLLVGPAVALKDLVFFGPHRLQLLCWSNPEARPRNGLAPLRI